MKHLQQRICSNNFLINKHLESIYIYKKKMKAFSITFMAGVPCIGQK